MPDVFTEKPRCRAFCVLTRQDFWRFCPFSLPRQRLEWGVGVILCKRGHGVEGEIPPAGGRRYLGALPGGPCEDMPIFRRILRNHSFLVKTIQIIDFMVVAQ